MSFAILPAHVLFGQSEWPPATFTPANPTTHHAIVASFTYPGLCDDISTTEVEGNVIRTTLGGGCIIGPPTFTLITHVYLGALPAGTYTYEIYFSYFGSPELRSTQQLIVADAPDVPAVSPTGALLMVAALVAAAMLILGVRSGSAA